MGLIRSMFMVNLYTPRSFLLNVKFKSFERSVN